MEFDSLDAIERFDVMVLIESCLSTLSQGMKRSDAETENINISAYSIGKIIRIDIKPKN